MGRCLSCKVDFPTAFISCPQCGGPVDWFPERMRSSAFRALLIVAGLGVMAAFVFLQALEEFLPLLMK